MLNKDVAKLLNEQINKEFYSAYLDSLTVDSEYGDIQIESIITNMTLHMEYGSINASGLQGTIIAKTQSGEITSESIPASDIIRGADDIGASYSGTMGNSTTEHKIDLFSEFGNIELN